MKLRFEIHLIWVVYLQLMQNAWCQKVIHSWSYVDFEYPSDSARNAAITMGSYVPENVAILDSDIYRDSRGNTRIFVSTPRFMSGIPATVSEVTDRIKDKSYLLRPFPDWQSQSVAECTGPTSVYRIHIDTCGRLWVVDTGRIDTFINPRRVCQPKILIYDLTNRDNLLQRYEFPNGVVTATSNLVTLVTDIRPGRSSCENAFAYIADVNAYGLVVYDFANSNSWRVNHNFFYPFPTYGTINVAGVTFDLMDGVFGIALGPLIKGDRLLYFHSLASLREGTVPAWALRNYTSLSAEESRSAFAMSGDARTSQSTLQVITDDGILIFGLLTKMAVACWNTRLPYTSNNIHTLYQNDNTLQFISGMKLLGDTLIVTTSKLQKYINGERDITDVKYRIITGSIQELLENSPCSPSSSKSRTTREQSYHPTQKQTNDMVHFPDVPFKHGKQQIPFDY